MMEMTYLPDLEDFRNAYICLMQEGEYAVSEKQAIEEADAGIAKILRVQDDLQKKLSGSDAAFRAQHDQHTKLYLELINMKAKLAKHGID